MIFETRISVPQEGAEGNTALPIIVVLFCYFCNASDQFYMSFFLMRSTLL